MRHLEVYDLSFQNLSERSMTFEQVYQRIERFMQKEPRGNYRLMVGTDSQVHSRSTRFITGVAIQRKGKGVWACYRKTVVPRRMDILHPRISYETSLTEEVVSLFTEERKNNLINIILPIFIMDPPLVSKDTLILGTGREIKQENL